MRGIFGLNDLTQTRKMYVKAALIFSCIPGLILILCNLLSDIDGPNIFIQAVIAIVGAPSAIAGILAYSIADNKLKRKLILTGVLILFQILILPIILGISNIKLRFFLFNHQTELEKIANNLLNNEWSWEYATEYFKTTRLPLKLEGQIKQDETVLFLISGVLDNCNGIAYSKTGKRAERNPCGQLILWARIKDNWYEWGTT
jgi:hypothetical protein